MARYDQSTNERPRSAFEAHLRRPFKRAVDIVRNRVNDLSVRMASQAFLDQYPARSVPYIFSKLYGPFDLLATRNNGEVGFDGNAPVVDLGAFITPRNQNIVVNREGSFYWCSTNVTGLVSLTYTSDPGTSPTPPIDTTPVSDIFNPVIPANGGAVSLLNFFGEGFRICWDLVLYDKKRGRQLHDGYLPPQVISGQGYSNKQNASPIRFDTNTEIEPRVRLLEVRPGAALDTDQAYDAAQFNGYLAIMFNGYKVLGD
jgi:hypothetical protein